MTRLSEEDLSELESLTLARAAAGKVNTVSPTVTLSLLSEVRKARKLEKYQHTRHLSGCAYYRDDPCTCGLSALEEE